MLDSATQRCKPGTKSDLCYLAMLIFNASLLFAQGSQPLTIPDGTPVELRFAQTIRRKAAVDPPTRPHTPAIDDVRPGDTVRLIVAMNLRVEGRVVIVKDAIAHATVTGGTSSFYTRRDPSETGLFLRLETVTGILNTEIPLRASKKGSQEPFYARLRNDHGGAVVYPAKIPHFIAGLPQIGDTPAFGESSWIPAGAHITAFIHGSVQLDRKAVEEAQSHLPAGGSAALVTVYRVKEGKHDHPSVFCDGELVAAIGEQQFAIQELTPGTHTCQVEDGKPLTIAATGGEEYFLRIHASGKNWELKRVESSEGQAAIANAQMVVKSDK